MPPCARCAAIAIVCGLAPGAPGADELAIEGQGARSDYTVSAESLEPGTGRGGSLNPDDVISDDRTSATGWVTGGTDSYTYEGALDIDVDGDARVWRSEDAGQTWTDITDASGELAPPPALDLAAPGTLRWEHPGAERYRVYVDDRQVAQTSDKRIRLARAIDTPGVYALSVSALDAGEESERSAALTVAYAVGADSAALESLREEVERASAALSALRGERAELATQLEASASARTQAQADLDVTRTERDALQSTLAERKRAIARAQARVTELEALVDALRPEAVEWRVAQYRDYADRPLYERTMFPQRIDEVARVAAGQPCERKTLLDSRGERQWRATTNARGQRGVAVCEPRP